jgi:hypothetical protein
VTYWGALLPVIRPLAYNVTKIASGLEHFLMLTSTGRVFSCGIANTYGQLGRNASTSVALRSAIEISIPQALINQTFIDIAAGSFFSMIMTSNGDVFGFGSNEYSQLGIGTTTVGEPVAVGINMTLIKSYGKVLSLAPGTYHSMMLVGYEGADCKTCFGYYSDDARVCSGRGKCVSQDKCACQKGYAGPQCEFIDCFGVLSNETNVCSGHGTCYAPNKCSCFNGYLLSICQMHTCFSDWANSTNVCSGRGKCSSVDKCDCFSGYSGVKCEFFLCNQTQSNLFEACSTHGFCMGPNNCSCFNGYFGEFCEAGVYRNKSWYGVLWQRNLCRKK